MYEEDYRKFVKRGIYCIIVLLLFIICGIAAILTLMGLNWSTASCNGTAIIEKFESVPTSCAEPCNINKQPLIEWMARNFSKLQGDIEEINKEMETISAKISENDNEMLLKLEAIEAAQLLLTNSASSNAQFIDETLHGVSGALNETTAAVSSLNESIKFLITKNKSDKSSIEAKIESLRISMMNNLSTAINTVITGDQNNTQFLVSKITETQGGVQANAGSVSSLNDTVNAMHQSLSTTSHMVLNVSQMNTKLINKCISAVSTSEQTVVEINEEVIATIQNNSKLVEGTLYSINATFGSLVSNVSIATQQNGETILELQDFLKSLEYTLSVYDMLNITNLLESLETNSILQSQIIQLNEAILNGTSGNEATLELISNDLQLLNVSLGDFRMTIIKTTQNNTEEVIQAVSGSVQTLLESNKDTRLVVKNSAQSLQQNITTNSEQLITSAETKISGLVVSSNESINEQLQANQAASQASHNKHADLIAKTNETIMEGLQNVQTMMNAALNNDELLITRGENHTLLLQETQVICHSSDRTSQQAFTEINGTLLVMNQTTTTFQESTTFRLQDSKKAIDDTHAVTTNNMQLLKQAEQTRNAIKEDLQQQLVQVIQQLVQGFDDQMEQYRNATMLHETKTNNQYHNMFYHLGVPTVGGVGVLLVIALIAGIIVIVVIVRIRAARKKIYTFKPNGTMMP